MAPSEAAIEAVGGAIGSVIAVAATYPLVIVSTWQALDNKNDDEDDMQEQRQYRVLRALPSPVKELCLYTKTKGWRSLFAGLKPCLAATAISQGVYFYLYSAIRQAVVVHKLSAQGTKAAAHSSRTTDIGVLGSIVVASLAGCGNVVATNPVWVVATQMQALQKRPEPELRRLSAMQVARILYEEEGIAGFWKGIWPALVMVANPTLQYIMYEWLTSRLLDMRRRASPISGSSYRYARLTTKDVFILTALAKMGSTFMTYPLLLIKSRLQAINAQTEEDMQYRGVFHAVSRILKDEGMRGFFKGMQVKMIQTVLSAALLMSIKEQVYSATRAALSTAPAKLQ